MDSSVSKYDDVNKPIRRFTIAQNERQAPYYYLYNPMPDPIKEFEKKEKKKDRKKRKEDKERKEAEEKKKSDKKEDEMCYRLKQEERNIKRYTVPKPRKFIREDEARHEAEKTKYHRCPRNLIRMASPIEVGRPKEPPVQMSSPHVVKKAKIMPEKISMTDSAIKQCEEPDEKATRELALREPKSKIIINEKKEEKKQQKPDVDSLDFIHDEQYRKYYPWWARLTDAALDDPEPEDIDRRFSISVRRAAGRESGDQVREFSSDTTSDSEGARAQNLKRSCGLFSLLKEPMRVKRMSSDEYLTAEMESSSCILSQYRPPSLLEDEGRDGRDLKVIAGKTNRTKESLAVAVVAYIYFTLVHPNTWTSRDIDDILEVGTILHCKSVKKSSSTVYKPKDILNEVIVKSKRIRFRIHGPDTCGRIRSKDPMILNLSRGLAIFFRQNNAGIMQTHESSMLVLRSDGRYYVFDSSPRSRKDFSISPYGSALLVEFDDLDEMVATLLNAERDLENWPFVISNISILNVRTEQSGGNISTVTLFRGRMHRAEALESRVLRGSFHVDDQYFNYAKYRLSVFVVVIALVYYQILPRGEMWNRNVLNRIMRLGYEFYKECAKGFETDDIRIDMIPSLFSVGNHVAEIMINDNQYAGLMARRSVSIFKEMLRTAFESYVAVVVEIQHDALAIWRDGRSYFMFDPYSRNDRGLRTMRDGKCCLLMNHSLEDIVDTVMHNYPDKEFIFKLHIVRHVRIHYDKKFGRFPGEAGGRKVPDKIIDNITVVPSENGGKFAPSETATYVAKNVDSIISYPFRKLQCLVARQDRCDGERDKGGGAPGAGAIAHLEHYIELSHNVEAVRGGALNPEQLIRASPFVSLVAVVMSTKYSLKCWNRDIVDNVATVGSNLHRKTEVPFKDIPKLDLTTGKSRFSIRIDYLGDTAFESNIFKARLKKHLFIRDPSSGVLLSENYSCAVFFMDTCYYLYDSSGTIPAMYRIKTCSELVKQIFLSERKFNEFRQPCRFYIYSVNVKKMNEEMQASKPSTPPMMKKREQWDSLRIGKAGIGGSGSSGSGSSSGGSRWDLRKLLNRNKLPKAPSSLNLVRKVRNDDVDLKRSLQYEMRPEEKLLNIVFRDPAKEPICDRPQPDEPVSNEGDDGVAKAPSASSFSAYRKSYMKSSIDFGNLQGRGNESLKQSRSTTAERAKEEEYCNYVKLARDVVRKKLDRRRKSDPETTTCDESICRPEKEKFKFEIKFHESKPVISGRLDRKEHKRHSSGSRAPPREDPPKPRKKTNEDDGAEGGKGAETAPTKSDKKHRDEKCIDVKVHEEVKRGRHDKEGKSEGLFIDITVKKPGEKHKFTRIEDDIKQVTNVAVAEKKKKDAEEVCTAPECRNQEEQCCCEHAANRQHETHPETSDNVEFSSNEVSIDESLEEQKRKERLKSITSLEENDQPKVDGKMENIMQQILGGRAEESKVRDDDELVMSPAAPSEEHHRTTHNPGAVEIISVSEKKNENENVIALARDGKPSTNTFRSKHSDNSERPIFFYEKPSTKGSHRSKCLKLPKQSRTIISCFDTPSHREIKKASKKIGSRTMPSRIPTGIKPPKIVTKTVVPCTKRKPDEKKVMENRQSSGKRSEEKSDSDNQQKCPNSSGKRSIPRPVPIRKMDFRTDTTYKLIVPTRRSTLEVIGKRVQDERLAYQKKEERKKWSKPKPFVVPKLSAENSDMFQSDSDGESSMMNDIKKIRQWKIVKHWKKQNVLSMMKELCESNVKIGLGLLKGDNYAKPTIMRSPLSIPDPRRNKNLVLFLVSEEPLAVINKANMHCLTQTGNLRCIKEEDEGGDYCNSNKAKPNEEHKKARSKTPSDQAKKREEYIKTIQKRRLEQKKLKERLGTKDRNGIDSTTTDTSESYDLQRTWKNDGSFGREDGKKLLVEGSFGLMHRQKFYGYLKECHFVCIYATLALFCKPLERWNPDRVDQVLADGKLLFENVHNVNFAAKRHIRNIYVDKWYIDVMVDRVIIPVPELLQRTLMNSLSYVLRKHRFCLLQLPYCCFVIEKRNTFYLFDPYGHGGKACWLEFLGMGYLLRYVQNSTYCLDTFEYYTVMISAAKEADEEDRYSLKDEIVAKAEDTFIEILQENEKWLEAFPVPWSRMNDYTADGGKRGEQKWCNWDIEWPEDLYSLAGTCVKYNKTFSIGGRSRQTFVNCVAAIIMVDVYDFDDWDVSVIDLVLKAKIINNRNTDEIQTIDFKIEFESVRDDVLLLTYKVNICKKPKVQGTLFQLLPDRFNLSNALRYFFEKHENRYGIIVCNCDYSVTKNLALGKVCEGEYFMYDCQTVGPPMWLNEKKSAPYILLCRSLNRLLHCLTLTLRGGDFFIYHIFIDDSDVHSVATQSCASGSMDGVTSRIDTLLLPRDGAKKKSKDKNKKYKSLTSIFSSMFWLKKKAK